MTVVIKHVRIHAVGRGFASRPGQTKDLHKNDINRLLLGMQVLW